MKQPMTMGELVAIENIPANTSGYVAPVLIITDQQD